MGLDLDLPRLRLATLVRKNRIKGGGNLSDRAGLEMGLEEGFMFMVAVEELKKERAKEEGGGE